MSQRESDHWSIGEVLSLIQEEFPEVTISKIRFLESKGLISPERTPSGYRRFYQDDFERLQWILRQQRDHYLPLKVIRVRLESGDLEGVNEVDPTPSLPFGGLDVEPQRRAPRTGRPLGRPDGEGTEPVASEQSAVLISTDDDSGDRDPASEGPEPAIVLDLAKAATVTPATVDPEAESVPQVEPVTGPEDASKSAENPDAHTQVAARTDRRRRGGGEAGRGSTAAMTKDELADASGCSPAILIELERFGLLSGRTIGPTVLYDSDALIIAKLAARFVDHGIEPRHLRTLKIGAEREMSLLSQVVEPALHRKDEAAREESLDALDDLLDLASQLREILIRQLVREQLPSQRG